MASAWPDVCSTYLHTGGVMKSFLTILVILVIGELSSAAIKGDDVFTPEFTQNQKEVVCQMNSGDTNKIKFKADNREKAMQAVTDKCLNIRVSNHIRFKNEEPSQERQMEYAMACLNSVSCNN